MAEVLGFTGYTSVPIPADKVLKSSVGKLDEAMVIGYEPDGAIYILASTPDIGQLLLLMERVKLELVTHGAEYA